MQSWAILFPNLRDLKGFLEVGKTSMRPELLDPWFAPPFMDDPERVLPDLLRSHLIPEKLERVYFGVEFCQRLIPEIGDVGRALELTREAGLALSFLTPPVTDAGLGTLRSRFALLEKGVEEAGDIEIIVNDWGTLRVVKKEFPGLRPVLGRMMNKMVRDPRVAPYYDSSNAPSDGLKAVQQSSVTNPLFERELRKWGVERHEFDNLYQGVKQEGEGVCFSVYLPYGYVATGRVCMPGSLNLEKGDKFTVYVGCHRECREFTQVLHNTETILSNRSLDLIQRGNTIFYPNMIGMIETALSGEAPGSWDRVVYQPQLPI